MRLSGGSAPTRCCSVQRAAWATPGRSRARHRLHDLPPPPATASAPITPAPSSPVATWRGFGRGGRCGGCGRRIRGAAGRQLRVLGTDHPPHARHPTTWRGFVSELAWSEPRARPGIARFRTAASGFRPAPGSGVPVVLAEKQRIYSDLRRLGGFLAPAPGAAVRIAPLSETFTGQVI